MYVPLAGPQRWIQRREVAAPVAFVSLALASREAWRRACPWLQVEVFEPREEAGGVRVVRVAGAAVSRLIRLPLRLVLRIEPHGAGAVLRGEGEIVCGTGPWAGPGPGSRLHLDGDVRPSGLGCRLEMTACADALPPLLRPLVAAAEYRVVAGAALAVESLFRDARRG